MVLLLLAGASSSYAQVSSEAQEYLNKGIEETKIPGRELRAMAWFGAYLAANPNASNSAAIKDQIKALDASNIVTLSKLINVYKNATDKLNQGPELKDTFLWRSADLWVLLGDVAKAEETAKLMSYVSDPLIGSIAAVKAKNGDFMGAEQTANGIKTDFDRQTALYAIALAEQDAGNAAGSKKILDKILNDKNADPSIVDEIISFEAQHNDIPAALEIANKLEHPSEALVKIAIAQKIAGDEAGAKVNIDRADTFIDRSQYPDYSFKEEFDKGITEFKTKKAAEEDVSVAAWTKLFEPKSSDDEPSLDKAYYKDVVGYVKSLPSEGPTAAQLFFSQIEEGKFDGDPSFFLERLRDSTEKMIKMRNTIKSMFKRMIKETSNPWADFFHLK